MGVFNFLNGEELKIAKHDSLLKSNILKASASNLLVIDKSGVIHYHTPAFLRMTKAYPKDFTVNDGESSLSGKHIDDIANGASASENLSYFCGKMLVRRNPIKFPKFEIVKNCKNFNLI